MSKRSARRARHENAESPTLKRGNPSSSSGRLGEQQFRNIAGKGLVHMVKTDIGWNEMSSSKTSTTGGDKQQVTIRGGSGGGTGGAAALTFTGLARIIDSAATPGAVGGQHAGLPSGHVNLVYDTGDGYESATIYNLASANSNLTIEDDEDGSGNSFIKLTAADQSVSLHRFDVLYAVDTTNATTSYTNASGSNGIVFQDTAETTWTIGSLANSKIPVSVDIDFPTMYTHPTSAGNKHIPTSGSANQFLKYSSSGTAVWATPSYTTNTNFYLTGVSKSGNQLTFAVSGAADPTYTFGSNAFNSTSFISNGIYLIEAYETDAVTTTATSSGADKLRFIETDDINWAISGPSSDIITITPTINFPTMYTDSNATSAMGSKGDSNPYHHDKYTHPTSAGNKHIPSGGAANQFLEYSASGTAVWATIAGGDLPSACGVNTSYVAAIVPSAASGTNLESMVDDGASGRIYSIKGGTGITVSIEGSESAKRFVFLEPSFIS